MKICLQYPDFLDTSKKHSHRTSNGQGWVLMGGGEGLDTEEGRL